MANKVVVFGGTTEGRKIVEFCSLNSIPVLYCVATDAGVYGVKGLSNITVNVERLSQDEMVELLKKEKPRLILDATHPYAVEVSHNISLACEKVNGKLLRVIRELSAEEGSVHFTSVAELVLWLEKQEGNIFVTTGANSAKDFTKLRDFQKRISLRILPSLDSLRTCLDLGYEPEQLICMQGPFSEELNKVLFQTANASILVTKNSGEIGGFSEKIQAAKKLGMTTAILLKSEKEVGVSLDQVYQKLLELKR